MSQFFEDLSQPYKTFEALVSQIIGDFCVVALNRIASVVVRSIVKILHYCRVSLNAPFAVISG